MRTNTSDTAKSEYPARNRVNYSTGQPRNPAAKTTGHGGYEYRTGAVARPREGSLQYGQRVPAERYPNSAQERNRTALTPASGQPYRAAYQTQLRGNIRGSAAVSPSSGRAVYGQPSAAPRPAEPRRLPAPTEYRRTGNGFAAVQPPSGQRQYPQSQLTRGNIQAPGRVPGASLNRLPAAYYQNSGQMYARAADGAVRGAKSQANTKNKRGNSQLERNAAANKRRKLLKMRDFALGLIIGFAIFGPAAYFVCQTIIGIFV